MKLFKSLVSHIAIVLNVCLLIVVYLDLRNPMMGFLMGAPFLILVASCALFSVTAGILLYAENRKHREELQKNEELHLKS